MIDVDNTAVGNFYDSATNSLARSVHLRELFGLQSEADLRQRIYYDTFPEPPDAKGYYTREQYERMIPCVILPSMGGLATAELRRIGVGEYEFKGNMSVHIEIPCPVAMIERKFPTSAALRMFQNNISAVAEDLCGFDSQAGYTQFNSCIFSVDYFNRASSQAYCGVSLVAYLILEF